MGLWKYVKGVFKVFQFNRIKNTGEISDSNGETIIPDSKTTPSQEEQLDDDPCRKRILDINRDAYNNLIKIRDNYREFPRYKERKRLDNQKRNTIFLIPADYNKGMENADYARITTTKLSKLSLDETVFLFNSLKLDKEKLNLTDVGIYKGIGIDLVEIVKRDLTGKQVLVNHPNLFEAYRRDVMENLGFDITYFIKP